MLRSDGGGGGRTGRGSEDVDKDYMGRCSVSLSSTLNIFLIFPFTINHLIFHSLIHDRVYLRYPCNDIFSYISSGRILGDGMKQ